MIRTCLLLLMTFVLSFCGKNEPETSSSADLSGTQWSGHFSAARDGAQLDPVAVDLSFDAANLFEIDFIENLKKVKGEYKDLPVNKRLILNVKDSEYEEFAKEGDTKIFNYAVENNELVIEGSAGEYLLSKVGADEKSEKEKVVFEGDWSCRDGKQNDWRFHIASDNFRAVKTGSEKRAIFLEGQFLVVSATSPTELALLKIRKSNADGVAGITLQVKMQKNQMLVEQLDKSGAVDSSVSAMKCNPS